MHETRALVLRREPSGEADSLVTLFTERYGKLRCLAQGLRRHGAKLQGHLEPGSIAEVSFVVGRNGFRLTTARRIVLGAGQESLEQHSALAAVIALLDENLLEDDERSAELFRMARDAILKLDRARDGREAGLIFAWFAGRFFDFLGLLPAPASPEGERCRRVASLAARPLSELPAGGDPRDLAAELAWIGRALGLSVRLPVPVTGHDFRL